jgi:hypothetical protein
MTDIIHCKYCDCLGTARPPFRDLHTASYCKVDRSRLMVRVHDSVK